VLEATIKGAGKTPPSSFSAGSKAPVSADVNGRPGHDFMTQRWATTGQPMDSFSHDVERRLRAGELGLELLVAPAQALHLDLLGRTTTPSSSG
jgi:hypothetical protein